MTHSSSARQIDTAATSQSIIDATWIRNAARAAGADDVGFVSIDRSDIEPDRKTILAAFPRAQTLIGFVCRLNPDAIRTPARSIANLEFHHVVQHTNAVAREIVEQLRERGARAINPSMAFPMEMQRYPEQIWIISHKRVAVAAGLGRMGIHRNVIHPKFGNFILLGTVITDARVTEESRPIDYNPCLECKLCVAACPVGAIASDGRFNFSACYTHNYREFMGGFTDWIERVAEARSAREYRQSVSDSETASMWQSLSFGANYKAAYCLAVCPAGEDVIDLYESNKRQYKADVLKPLQLKEETVYVVPGSDAENHVAKRFKNKHTKHVGNGLRPRSIDGFINGLALTFQPNRAKELKLDATYQFTFTGACERKATVHIKNGALLVRNDHEGAPDVKITVDSQAWLDLLTKNRSMISAVILRKLRVRGKLSLMKKFGECFPS